MGRIDTPSGGGQPSYLRMRQDSNLGTTSVTRLAGGSLRPLGHASKAEGEGVEPPSARTPAVFETVYRTTWQSLRVAG